MPIQLLFTQPLVFLAWILAIIFGITIHEFAHVFAAYVQGDRTGKDMGRLTLNPMVHIDPLGLLLLVVAGFGWGRPAPYNPYHLKRPKLGSVWVALAGPLSNLLAILAFGGLFRLVYPLLDLSPNNLLVVFLVFLVQINIILMLFNLIPIPPLDGSRILENLLPDSMYHFKVSLERYGPWLLLALILFGGGLFTHLFNVVNTIAARVLG